MSDSEIHQTVSGDYNVVAGSGPVRINNYQLPPSDPEERRILLQLAQKVKKDWVVGVLKNSLQEREMIELSKESLYDMVTPPLGRLLELPTQPPRPIPAQKDICEVFDEASCELLILGEPGGGKTMTLLSLASTLIERFETDPTQALPVVLHLSTWREDRTLGSWVETEMKNLYSVPLERSRRWLNEFRLILLLDGLDEVDIDRRTSCVTAINQRVGLSGIAVCSRRNEYSVLRERLGFRAAVNLQLLAREQVESYLENAGDQLASLLQAIREDKVLAELAQTPLILNMMSQAYRGVGAEAFSIQDGASLKERRKQIFAFYVEQMFKRKRALRFQQDKAIRWLAWLARMMREHWISIFFVEELQRSWLSSKAELLACRIVVVLLLLPFASLFYMLTFILLPLMHGGGLAFVNKDTAMVGLVLGLIHGVTLELSGYSDTHILLRTHNNWKSRALAVVKPTLILGLALLLASLYKWAFVLLLLNAVFNASALHKPQKLRHLGLRLILWHKGYTPLRLVAFLDDCARRIFLKQVGHGYIFIHRMVLDYFAELTPEHECDLFMDRPAPMRNLLDHYEKLGSFQQRQGQLNEALQAYQQSLEIRLARTEQDRSNSDWQEELSVAYSKVGDVLMYQGKLPDALDAHEQGLAIAKRLVQQDYTHSDREREQGKAFGVYEAGSRIGRLMEDKAEHRWRTHLARSYDNVGNVLLAGGKLFEASEAFQQSLTIRQMLTEIDTTDSHWQGLLSHSYEKIGDVRVTQDELPEALKAYEQSLTIRKKVAAEDKIKFWEPWLCISYEKVGDVLARQGKLVEALAAYQKSLTIRTTLAERHKVEHPWNYDFSRRSGNLRNALRARRDIVRAHRKHMKAFDSLTQAMKSAKGLEFLRLKAKLFENYVTYEREKGSIRYLTEEGEIHLSSQRNLSIIHYKIGDVLVAQGEHAEALEAYQRSLTIRRTLTAGDDPSVGRESDRLFSYCNFGDLLTAQGQLAAALEAYKEGLAAAVWLVDHDKTNGEWQRILLVALYNVGTVAAQIGDDANVAEAQESLVTALNLTNKYPGTDRQQWVERLSRALERIRQASGTSSP